MSDYSNWPATKLTPAALLAAREEFAGEFAAPIPLPRRPIVSPALAKRIAADPEMADTIARMFGGQRIAFK